MKDSREKLRKALKEPEKKPKPQTGRDTKEDKLFVERLKK